MDPQGGKAKHTSTRSAPKVRAWRWSRDSKPSGVWEQPRNQSVGDPSKSSEHEHGQSEERQFCAVWNWGCW
jgi:hypothetical protein